MLVRAQAMRLPPEPFLFHSHSEGCGSFFFFFLPMSRLLIIKSPAARSCVNQKGETLHLKRRFSENKPFASVGEAGPRSQGCDLVEPPGSTSGAGSDVPMELSTSPHTSCAGEPGGERGGPAAPLHPNSAAGLAQVPGRRC